MTGSALANISSECLSAAALRRSDSCLMSEGMFGYCAIARCAPKVVRPNTAAIAIRDRMMCLVLSCSAVPECRHGLEPRGTGAVLTLAPSVAGRVRRRLRARLSLLVPLLAGLFLVD